MDIYRNGGMLPPTVGRVPPIRGFEKALKFVLHASVATSEIYVRMS